MHVYVVRMCAHVRVKMLWDIYVREGVRVYDCNTWHAVLVPVHFHVYDMHVLV